MKKIYESTLDLIGSTPLVRLEHFAEKMGIEANLYAKVESANLTGSMKDRVALAMIREAEASGELQAGGSIIEPTSGNTGIGLAAVGRILGYQVTLVMPDTMSVERQKLMKAYGAEVVLSNGKNGMSGAIAEAERLKAERKNAIIAGQFDNKANPEAHYQTTGPEIWEAMEGKIDAVVAGVGTGGSISGIGRYLKEKDDQIQMVAVEPVSSAVLSGEATGKHGIQGIGAGFIPGNYDASVVDDIIQVKDDEAWDVVRFLAQVEGLFVGVSSGAALVGAKKWLASHENAKEIVVILPDTGMRYLSSDQLM